MLKNFRLRRVEREMQDSESYSEWTEHAREHDEISGAARWRGSDQSSLYDYASIRRRLDRLRFLRARHDDAGLLFTLNEGIHGNMGGMGSSKLYQRARSGTKQLVENYIAEIVDALEHIAELGSDEIDATEKQDFFYRANHCFGRSALMLSGGGTLGFYHLGVVKSLLEEGLLPRVISGSSAGAFIAGLLGTHTDDELREFFEKGNLMQEAREEASLFEQLLAHPGSRIDADTLKHSVDHLVPDLTFQEAYEKTGRQISISVAPAEPQQTSRLLNAITSPNLFVRSAIMASCAVPGVFPPVVLSAKNVHGEPQDYLPNRKWIDGSISDDLPAKRLGRLYGTNHTIVSMVNPLVVPFIRQLDNAAPLYASASRMGLELSREVLQFYRQQFQRYVPAAPVNAAVNGMYSLLDQNYSGDVTIVPSFRWHNPMRWLAHPTEEELLFLVREGERSTWPHLHAIETTTRISRTLDRILESFEAKPARLVRAARRRQPRKPKASSASKSTSKSKKSGSSPTKAA